MWTDIQFLVYVDDNCFIVLVKKPVHDRFLEYIELWKDVGQMFSPCKQTKDFKWQNSMLEQRCLVQ